MSTGHGNRDVRADTHYKTCPRCQTKTGLHAERCHVCGREYQTKFAVEKTLVHTISQPAQPRLNPQPTTAQAGTSDYLFDEVTHQYKALITWQIVGTFCLLSGPLMLLFLLPVGMVLVPIVLPFTFLFPLLIPFAFLLGIGGLVYALVQKPNLRRQVAGMGRDSRAWSEPMEQRYWRIVLTGVGAMFAWLIILIAFSSINRAVNPPMPPLESTYRQYQHPGF